MKNYLAIIFCLLSIQLFAHNGEEDGPKAQAKGQTYFSAHGESELFELVLHYTPIEANKPTKMKLFLSDFISNAPIDGATFQITCLEKNDLKFSTTQLEKGIYEVSGTFPENKKYSFAVSITAKDNSDLLTLKGIEVGKKLETVTVPQINSSFSMMNIVYILIAFVIGIVLTFLLMRKRISRKTIAMILVLISFSAPLTNYQSAYAHNGEEDGLKSLQLFCERFFFALIKM